MSINSGTIICDYCGAECIDDGICMDCENRAEIELAEEDACFDKLAHEIGIEKAIQQFYGE